MAAKHKSKEERYEQILQAAFICFSKKGYHATTMQDIADEANISKGAIFYYFENKKALFVAFVESFFFNAFSEFETLIKDEYSFINAISTLLNFFSDESRKDDFQNQLKIMMEYWTQALTDEEIYILIRKLYKPFLDKFETYIKLAIERGEIVDIDSKILSLFIVNIADMMFFDYAFFREDFDFQKLIDGFVSIIKNGIVKKEVSEGLNLFTLM